MALAFARTRHTDSDYERARRQQQLIAAMKLRGTEKQRSLLTRLLRVLEGLPHSTVFIQSLVDDLDEYGSFQAGR